MEMVKKKSFPRMSIYNIPTITSTEIPPVFFYPLIQGGGKEPEIKVKIKQKVKSGEILAGPFKRGDAGAQNIHTAVGGVVENIRTFRYSGNYNNTMAVEIEFGGQLNTFSNAQELDSQSLDSNKVFSDIKAAGIFDLDIGAVGVKIEAMLQNKIKNIVLNAIEISPFMMLEEKVLELHPKEITLALAVLQQAIKLKKKNNEEPDIVVVSNYLKNRKNIIRNFSQFAGKSKKIQAKKLSLGIDVNNVPRDNYLWLLQALFDSQQLETSSVERSIEETLILKPSTLLAIYEAVFCGKPYIEKYVQIIVDEKKTFVFKAFLGIPLFYLLTQTNKIENGVNHFFIDDFMKRSVVFDFTTPVSKHFSHIFALTDESFSILYNRLRPWQKVTQQD